MRRPCSALLVVSALLCSHVVQAEPRADRADPVLQVKDNEPHVVSVVTQGLLGATAGAVMVVGAALVANATDAYRTLDQNTSAGASCRPCSSSDLTDVRTRGYVGYALLGLGGALLVTDIALIVIDARHRSTHMERPVARAGSLGLGVRF
jgi:hypothetical protein